MIIDLARNVSVILGCITLIASIVYWAIKAKLKDDFCSKEDCMAKHKTLHDELSSYRKDIAEDIKEIKDIVIRMENRFYDWINLQVNK